MFFHNSLQPLPRLHRCKRPSNSQRNVSVQSPVMAGNVFVQPIAAECWRGRGGKLSRILGIKHNVNEHSVDILMVLFAKHKSGILFNLYN